MASGSAAPTSWRAPRPTTASRARPTRAVAAAVTPFSSGRRRPATETRSASSTPGTRTTSAATSPRGSATARQTWSLGPRESPPNASQATAPHRARAASRGSGGGDPLPVGKARAGARAAFGAPPPRPQAHVRRYLASRLRDSAADVVLVPAVELAERVSVTGLRLPDEK